MEKQINKYRNLMGMVITQEWLNNKAGTPENTFLWSLQQLLMLRLLGDKAKANSLEIAMKSHLDACWNHESGMLNNIPDQVDPSNKDAWTSPDQIAAYGIYSKLFKRYEHEHLYITLNNNLYTYDNLTGKINFRRLIHPREVCFLALLNDEASFFERWAFYLSCVATFSSGVKKRPTITNCIKHLFKTGKWPVRMTFRKTDMELIYWCRRQVVNMPNWLDRYADKQIKKQFGSWPNAFKEYFGENHPNHLLAKDIYERN